MDEATSAEQVAESGGDDGNVMDHVRTQLASVREELDKARELIEQIRSERAGAQVGAQATTGGATTAEAVVRAPASSVMTAAPGSVSGRDAMAEARDAASAGDRGALLVYLRLRRSGRGSDGAD